MRNKETSLGTRRIQHFRKRLMERVGLVITDEEIEKIIEDIFQYVNKPVMILEENGNSFHLLEIQGTEIIILFDWETNVPLTVYHSGWLKTDENGKYDFHYRAKAKDIRVLNRSYTFTQKTGIQNNIQVCSRPSLIL